MTANQKRKAVKNFKYLPEPIHSYSNAPIVQIPNEAKSIIEMFNRKLCCALYFKELGKALPKDHVMTTTAFPLGHKNSEKMLEFANSNLNGLVITNRPNVDLGKQFVYRFGKRTGAGIFAYTAQFHLSFTLTGFVAPPNKKVNDRWIPHHRDIESNWRWKLDEINKE